jgi:hypothetical protein
MPDASASRTPPHARSIELEELSHRAWLRVLALLKNTIGVFLSFARDLEAR